MRSRNKTLVLQENTRSHSYHLHERKIYTLKKKKDLSDVCKKSHNISQSHYLMIQNIFRETKKKKKFSFFYKFPSPGAHSGYLVKRNLFFLLSGTSGVHMKLGSRVSRVSEPQGGNLVRRLSRGLISLPQVDFAWSRPGLMGYFMLCTIKTWNNFSCLDWGTRCTPCSHRIKSISLKSFFKILIKHAIR